MTLKLLLLMLLAQVAVTQSVQRGRTSWWRMDRLEPLGTIFPTSGAVVGSSAKLLTVTLVIVSLVDSWTVSNAMEPVMEMNLMVTPQLMLEIASVVVKRVALIASISPQGSNSAVKLMAVNV
jgi:hypothetical protein